MNLYRELLAYKEKNIIPMHMPGHKRMPPFTIEDSYAIDVTEVDGTDNLHHPMGIIRGEMERIRAACKTKESYLLVNGSTCGILAAVSACCRRGDRILMDRNCHRSVYHIVYLLELEPVYLYREIDRETGIPLPLSVEQVERELGVEQNFSCAILTSPTYEGVVSDIAEIAAAVHRKEIPLIVDQAHGAHLNWWKCMDEDICAGSGRMESAVTAGADLVVESLHKTLPALTQTALLHLCSHRVECEKIERYLDIYETSSPSYVLLASVGQCIQWMEDESGKWFSVYEKNLKHFAKTAADWKCLRLWRHPAKDPGKLVICVPLGEASGVVLAERLLRDYQIQIEMAAPGYVLAMTSLCDTKENFERLSQALREIDREMAGNKTGGGSAREKKGQAEFHRVFSLTGTERAQVCMNAYAAVNKPREKCLLEECRGRISAEYAFVYPPGIPFLVPGERITEEVVYRIAAAGEEGLTLSGMREESGAVWVVRET